MYKYNAKLDRVVDGDTIDALVDLGFDTWKRWSVWSHVTASCIVSPARSHGRAATGAGHLAVPNGVSLIAASRRRNGWSSVWNVSEAATYIVSASGALQPPAPLQTWKGM